MSLKVAIVHDELLRKGGAERVVISMHKTFPSAHIYTLAYNQDTTFEYFKTCTIITSFLDRFVNDEKMLMKLFFPFGIMAMRAFNLKDYDLVILSSAHGAQYIRKQTGNTVVNYAHYVFRLIWEPESYTFYRKHKWILNPLFKGLQWLDKRLNVRADFTIFNSSKTQKKYLEVFPGTTNYRIINPPISLNQFVPSNTDDHGYYLIVSRFEPYKRVDLVIEAFKAFAERKLIVVGKGTLRNQLMASSKGFDNIVFKEEVSNNDLKKLYRDCRALIFPQVEDFGITPLEANASGRPVIAFNQGGVLETMIPYGQPRPTAVFFENQQVDALNEAILIFEKLSFKKQDCVDNVRRFDEGTFQNKLLEYSNPDS